jgi:L-galactono-1,4-lactone dehydrogenase
MLRGFSKHGLFASSLIGGAIFTSQTHCEIDEECKLSFEKSQNLSNWSSTHHCTVSRIYEPKTERELDRLLRHHQLKNLKLRPIGTALSPNGISFPDAGCDGLSLFHFDKIVVDLPNSVVVVGAGATVANVLKELAKHGLTLENFSSIQEQQMAGWTQVAAHGTGCTLPTVEEQIVSMKISTPTEGLLTLSSTSLPHIFRMAKVGLGCIGVVSELTLRCIPQLSLKETLVTYNRMSIQNDHYNRLRNYRHVRYMWIPYTSCVVSVHSNPTPHKQAPAINPTLPSSALPTRSLIELIKLRSPVGASHSEEYLRTQGFAQLRDIALGLNPLDLEVAVHHISYSVI